MERKVVVTGLDVVTSIGIGKDEFWKNLVAARSGIGDITLFDTARFNRSRAGEIKNFDAEDHVASRKARFLGRASQFAVAATRLALEDARLALKGYTGKTGIIMGTTMTEAGIIDYSSEMFYKKKEHRITPDVFINAFSASIARNLGYYFGMKGENLMIPCACAAGNYAIGYGFDLIRKGEIDLAITGGADSLSRGAFQGFQRLYAMSPDVCSPFDKNRKGMLLGEGAGILILESYESAVKRGANVYAEVLGYGVSCDAYHITIPKREGIRKAIRKAIDNAGLAAGDIDYINAHGTGTGANDKEESGAIRDVFGARHRDVPVSSIKSMLGHCMGAASSIEAATCCLTIANGVIPPTINYRTPDPDCDIDCVPNTARKANVRTAINNGFAFGGNNCCVTFRSVP